MQTVKQSRNMLRKKLGNVTSAAELVDKARIRDLDAKSDEAHTLIPNP